MKYFDQYFPALGGELGHGPVTANDIELIGRFQVHVRAGLQLQKSGVLTEVEALRAMVFGLARDLELCQNIIAQMGRAKEEPWGG